MKKKLTNLVQHTMVKKAITAGFSAAMLMSAVPVHANNPAPNIKADAPNRYVVKKGDTLWDISGRYLDSPWRWRDIWAANKHVKNPNLIYPKDVLLMCIIKGETLVGIDTGEGCAGIEEAMDTSDVAPTEPAAPKPTQPKPQRVTITPLNDSIPAIPLGAIQHWLDRVLIVEPEDFEATPYVLASKNRNLITAAGDEIYAKGVPLIVGQRYGVYRKGEPYIDPRTREVVGLEVTQVAAGVATRVAGNGITSIKLLQSYDSEVREGDRIFVEMGHSFTPAFHPVPANVNRGGLIVRVVDSIGNAARGSVVATNLGSENGAKPGDVLTVYRRGPLVRDIKDDDMPVRLPDEEAGYVMIFKTFDKISYAYVLDTVSTISTGDKLLPPRP